MNLTIFLKLTIKGIGSLERLLMILSMLFQASTSQLAGHAGTVVMINL